MENYKFDDLIEIMKKLRLECPWDKEQTHKSIRRNFLEETYEACEAIDNDDTELLKEELGDVLLQVVFHTEMEREKGIFDIDDVIDGLCKKLIFRHPHIFSNTQVSGTDEVLSNWDELKKIEKKQQSSFDVLNSVSKALPALIRAEKVYKKALKEHVVDDIVDDIEYIAKKIKEGETNKIPELVQNLVKIYQKEGSNFEENVHKSIDDFIKSVK